MSKRWMKLGRAEAVAQAALVVDVLDKPALTRAFDINWQEYDALCDLFGYRVNAWKGDVVGRPTDFSLTIMYERDLHKKPLTVALAIEIAVRYMGKALKDTYQDRKRFATRINEAGVKRRGGELDGRAGYGRRR